MSESPTRALGSTIRPLYFFGVVSLLMLVGLYCVQEVAGTGPDANPRPMQCARIFSTIYFLMALVTMWRRTEGEVFHAFGAMAVVGLVLALLLATVAVVTPPLALLLSLVFANVAAVLTARRIRKAKRVLLPTVEIEP